MSSYPPQKFGKKKRNIVAKMVKWCPWIDGSREKRLSALAKMAEIGILLVVLFIMQEFRTDTIPYGCPQSAKASCLAQFDVSGTDQFFGLCEDSRSQCWYMVSPLLGNPPNMQTSVGALGLGAYNTSFQYCLCLMQAVQHNGKILPGVCQFSNIFPILVFAFGAGLVVLMECLLKRWLTSFIVYLACVFFFVVSYITVGSLEWYSPPLCTGVHWNRLVTILVAIVIGECVLFTLAWCLMVLGASRKLPGNMIEYDAEAYYEAQLAAKAAKRRANPSAAPANASPSVVL
jgi:hypothetical protein